MINVRKGMWTIVTRNAVHPGTWDGNGNEELMSINFGYGGGRISWYVHWERGTL